jgi:hypothetical protein
MKLSLSTLVAVALIPLAWVETARAQPPVVRTEGGDTQEQEKAARMEKEKKLAAEKGDSGDVDGTGGDPGLVTPASLSNFAFPHVSTRPRRLGPGEAGTLVIVVTLTNPAVIAGTAPVALEYQARQTALDLGMYAVAPAKLGTLDTKFRGQPVYDNTLTVEIPLTVQQDAQRTEQQVSLMLKTTLTNGTNGQAMGELVLPVAGKVHIGQPVPKPVARDLARAAGPGDNGAGETAAAPAATAASKASETNKRATAPAPARGTMTATSAEGISLEVDFPTGANVALGATTEAIVTVRIPVGAALSRFPEALRLDVMGADHGVEAMVSAWPAPGRRSGQADLPVSENLVSAPILFSASPDAAVGVRNLDLRLSYSLVDGTGTVSPPQTINLPAVLAVGIEPTVANPWVFYTAGAVLAGLLAVLLARGMRR